MQKRPDNWHRYFSLFGGGPENKGFRWRVKENDDGTWSVHYQEVALSRWGKGRWKKFEALEAKYASKYHAAYAILDLYDRGSV